MAYTLGDMVDSILASMDGDEVNSYDDTQESRQVAQIIKDTYYDIVYRLDPPLQDSLIELEASGDNSKPTIMYLPDNARDITWIKYDNSLSTDSGPIFKDVRPQDLDDFLDRMFLIDVDSTAGGYYTHSINNATATIDIFYLNDRAPTRWTTFDNYTIIFDSYNSAEDTTLQKSKTLCSAKLMPTFTLTDNFTPDLDESQFPLLLNEAKAMCFAELRQTSHAKAEKRAKQQWNKAQVSKYRAKPHSYYQDRLPNYGRK